MANWYTFMGGDPLAASNYYKSRFTSSTTAPSCSNGCKICAILINDTGFYATTPFSGAQIQLIIDALADGTAQVNGGFEVRLKCP